MGVNLPAHLVVLKGTRRWSSDAADTAGYQEYDRSTCLQMIGRAGRPQFDTEGVAVIMTQKQVAYMSCIKILHCIAATSSASTGKGGSVSVHLYKYLISCTSIYIQPCA